MGGFCPTKTCFRKSGKWQHGNVFIPEHLCFRIASQRFELAAGVSKIDLERSILTFINFRDNVRIEDVVVLADSSKELRRTGLGEFVDRPEQRDAEALCRKFPNYVKNPRPLQSGQWMVDFIQLARPQQMRISAPGSPGDTSWLRKLTKTAKAERKRKLSDITDGELSTLLLNLKPLNPTP